MWALIDRGFRNPLTTSSRISVTDGTRTPFQKYS
jgi:hypothetical protein